MTGNKCLVLVSFAELTLLITLTVPLESASHPLGCKKRNKRTEGLKN